MDAIWSGADPWYVDVDVLVIHVLCHRLLLRMLVIRLVIDLMVVYVA
jgi:hypothetical protein